MSAPILYAYQDLVQHLVDLLGGGALAANQREFHAAVQGAYQEVANTRDWQSLVRQGRLVTSAPYSSGTIQFQSSSGSYPNQVTLTTTDGSVWPSDAIYGTLRVNNVNAEISLRVDDHNLQLDPHVTFPEDWPAGTTYTWFRSHYYLPADFRRTNELLYEGTQWISNYIPQADMLRLERIVSAGGYPTHFSVIASPRLIGSWELWLYPYPNQVASVDFIYGSAPRQISFTGYEPNSTAGTVTISPGSNTVTGTGTQFSAAMAGSLIRVSSDTDQQPSGIGGLNPFAEQKIIMKVTGTGSLTVDSPFVNGYTATQYCVTDPIDLMADLLEFLLRTAEYKIALIKQMSDIAVYQQNYKEAKIRAMESDQRSIQQRWVGRTNTFPRLLRWMPFNSATTP